jgi:putative flippase GtrA
MKTLASVDPTARKSLLRQFLLFTGVGAIGTGGHYMTLVLLVHLGNLAPVYASTAGFAVGACINYVLNYRYTFHSHKKHSEALVKFMLVALLGVAINGLIMYLGTEWMQINYLLVQIFATGIVLLSNFSFNKLWTFAHKDLEKI